MANLRAMVKAHEIARYLKAHPKSIPWRIDWLSGHGSSCVNSEDIQDHILKLNLLFHYYSCGPFYTSQVLINEGIARCRNSMAFQLCVRLIF